MSPQLIGWELNQGVILWYSTVLAKMLLKLSQLKKQEEQKVPILPIILKLLVCIAIIIYTDDSQCFSLFEIAILVEPQSARFCQWTHRCILLATSVECQFLKIQHNIIVPSTFFLIIYLPPQTLTTSQTLLFLVCVLFFLKTSFDV